MKRPFVLFHCCLILSRKRRRRLPLGSSICSRPDVTIAAPKAGFALCIALLMSAHPHQNMCLLPKLVAMCENGGIPFGLIF
jgi:hypothetical protein